jgi:hypothetical protein
MWLEAQEQNGKRVESTLFEGKKRREEEKKKSKGKSNEEKKLSSRSTLRHSQEGGFE